jgi:hypothetical protein
MVLTLSSRGQWERSAIARAVLKTIFPSVRKSKRGARESIHTIIDQLGLPYARL